MTEIFTRLHWGLVIVDSPSDTPEISALRFFAEIVHIVEIEYWTFAKYEPGIECPLKNGIRVNLGRIENQQQLGEMLTTISVPKLDPAEGGNMLVEAALAKWKLDQPAVINGADKEWKLVRGLANDFFDLVMNDIDIGLEVKEGKVPTFEVIGNVRKNMPERKK